MLFPTLDFAIFFLIVFAESWRHVSRETFRKLLLLGASYVFYAWWDWRFCGLLAASSLFNYLAGMAVGRLESPKARRWVVALAVVVNLTVLGFFKYYGFFLDSAAELLEALSLERDLPIMQVILPVGISFFTFQGISYVVDVSRREIEPARSPLDVFLYISFFPQLVAGPIVRAAHFLPQLKQTPTLTRQALGYGVTLILLGLFKKMIVANYLATEIVDLTFFDPDGYGSIDLWIGVYAYAIQIYCDFSGYSDIGIGCAALLGFHFHKNFNQPYRATSLQDFWRRWHISLSEWLRDYLYKPLGGSRGSALATYRNLALTMLLGGLWHGAAWTFVIWGAIHGAGLAFERALRTAGYALRGWLGAIAGFLITFHIVCFCWIFFRSETLDVVWRYLGGMTARWDAEATLATPFVAGLVAVGMLFQFLPSRLPEQFGAFAARLGWLGLGLLLGGGIWLIEVLGPDGVAPFIYFQF